MSKFINKETMEYLKSKENSTTGQQLQNIRERLNLENEQQSARCAKLERDSLNHSDLITHLGTNMLEMQRIVDEKYYNVLDHNNSVIGQVNDKFNKMGKKILIAGGVIAVWLITLLILTLRHG